ncbi:MAG: 4-(cytidine 5'-diphospho)-2-C-methyl-D-erythritol kinase, partial [Oscillospiraceae bacterium]|nr:4-(cytidine 5'-diphospho)-2-C-methyl-D-erythritol kinase [Oscillospiraceae bacterium]
MNTQHAFAKINLCLDVLGKRKDGYHDVRTIMHSIALGDTISIVQTAGRGVKFICDTPYLPSDDRNNAVKAVKLFIAAAGLSHDFRLTRLNIHCIKRIPVCGGLGGSSSDAAAVLRLMNRTCGYPFTTKQLAAMSHTLGSDVPFGVIGGCALCEG